MNSKPNLSDISLEDLEQEIESRYEKLKLTAADKKLREIKRLIKKLPKGIIVGYVKDISDEKYPYYCPFFIKEDVQYSFYYEAFDIGIENWQDYWPDDFFAESTENAYEFRPKGKYKTPKELLKYLGYKDMGEVDYNE